jgi:hypothetical protein
MRKHAVPHLAGALALLAVGLTALATGCPFKAEEFQRLCDKASDCADGNPCTEDKCTAGVCENHSKTKGSSCGSGREGVCDGEGSCVECTSNATCAADHPDKPICDTKTQKCVSCFDGVKNGSEEDVDCGGPDCGACVGDPCDPVRGCGQGVGGQLRYCVTPENICCETACDQKCEACVNSLTGQPDGTCAPIPDGKDTAQHGTCSVPADKCSATPNKCRCEDSQKDYDETDVDCGGSVCTGCTGGKACNTASDCAVTYPACVNGACCVSMCKAQCRGCDSAGQCSDLPAGHLDPTCTGTQACGANGAGCVGRAGAVCASGLDCLSGTCAGSGSSKTCAKSGSGGACTDGTDCVSANCQNYRCQ